MAISGVARALAARADLDENNKELAVDVALEMGQRLARVGGRSALSRNDSAAANGSSSMRSGRQSNTAAVVELGRVGDRPAHPHGSLRLGHHHRLRQFLPKQGLIGVRAQAAHTGRRRMGMRCRNQHLIGADLRPPGRQSFRFVHSGWGMIPAVDDDDGQPPAAVIPGRSPAR